MKAQNKSKIGKRGEILPKKHLRDEAGLKPGDEILITAVPGEIRIKKVYSVDELLHLPILQKTTPQDAERDINEEAKSQQEMSFDES